MDTLAFLAKVTPTAGLKVLAERVTKQQYSYWSHTSYETHDAMARAALALDAQGKTVYFAVNSFTSWYETEVAGEVKRRIRTQENVHSCRSLYDDIDTGKPGTYPSAKVALQAVADAVRAGLPKPMIVFSGGGLHLYWPLDRDIGPDEWQELAAYKRQAIAEFELCVDHAVDTDSARVLRPVGTTNRKREHPERVALLGDVAPYDPKLLREAFAPYVSSMPMASGFGMFGLEVSSDLGAKPEYPPSSAERIEAACGALAEIVDAPQAASEPQWRAMLGLVKHTTEGRALAHTWSQGHPEYSQTDTDAKFDMWQAGPPTCAEFGKYSDACKSCPYSGKIKSPIFLGYSEEPPAQPEGGVQFDNTETKPPENAPAEQYMPRGFSVLGGRLHKAVKDENGVVSWTAVSNAHFVPTRNVVMDDGAGGVEFETIMDGKVYDHVCIPSKAVSAPDTFASMMGTRHVYFLGRNGKHHAVEYAVDYISHLMRASERTPTFDSFGWTDNYAGFVLGTNMIRSDGQTDVLPGERLDRSRLAQDSNYAGTVDAWVEAVDHVYNRPGAEPYQFVIASAFGSPLVALLGSDNWHGIPVAVTGGGGVGKTTVCAVASSVYGCPSKLKIAANSSGATMVGMYILLGTARNVPLVLDELTGRENREVYDMMYALSQGRPRIRAQSDGTLQELKATWDSVNFITSNANITELLYQYNNSQADAVALRCFEIRIADGFIKKVFGGISGQVEIEDGVLARNYGLVGRVYLQYLIRNLDTVKALLRQVRAKMEARSKAKGRDRFYMDLIASTMTGAILARQLGLLRFDVKALQEWALGHAEQLLQGQSELRIGPEETFARFVADLHGHVIVSQNLLDGRSKREGIVAPRLPPAARIATRPRVAFVSAAYFRAWCSEHNLSHRDLRDELRRTGVFIEPPTPGLAKNMSLGRGTDCPTAQEPVIFIDYEKLLPASEEEQSATVLPMRRGAA